ncbi:MAG: hypothetical protein HY791_05645 [Deltaproteobacteria bacterium]|nr:hypothetical protein [Deltaproteobacteria bacterium]
MSVQSQIRSGRRIEAAGRVPKDPVPPRIAVGTLPRASGASCKSSAAFAVTVPRYGFLGGQIAASVTFANLHSTTLGPFKCALEVAGCLLGIKPKARELATH